MRLRPRILIALLTAAALCAGVAPAGAQVQTLHLHFQRIATGVDDLYTGVGVRTSGSYVLASLGKPDSNQYPSRFLLIDDATGKRTVLRPGGSSTVSAFGAPWILFWRHSRFELYNIATRRWRALGCGSRCSLAGSSEIDLTLGSRWLEFAGQTCGEGQCGPVRYLFYNLRTGKVRRGSPQTSTRIVDLDSATLAHKLCPPLRVPSGGSVTIEGRVGIVTDGLSSYLERCGSNVHVTIAPGTYNAGLACSPGAPMVCSHAVVWNAVTPPRLDGVWLPSLRRFTAEMPNRLETASWFLDAKRLYAVDQRDVLWAATLGASRPRQVPRT